jgi:hypothetical protein
MASLTVESSRSIVSGVWRNPPPDGVSPLISSSSYTLL